MSTAELKIDLINKFANLKDTNILDEIQKLLDFELDENVFELSNEQHIRMAEAEEEYKNGKIITDVEADKAISEWLNEK